MAVRNLLPTMLVSVFSLAALVNADPIRPPSKRECFIFAEAGSCVTCSKFMSEHCRSACDERFRRQRLQRFESPIAESFYDLVANDINGNQVDFSIFEDKVTVIVNVASECGYTEDHYREMVQLYDSLSSTGAFELLAFPCNQFDGQEPGDLEDIKAFTASKGVKFRVMDKINVNGRGTHDVYRYLKSVAGPDDEIEWNFAMYYVVDFEGKVHAYNNRTPLELRETIEELLGGLSEYA